MSVKPVQTHDFTIHHRVYPAIDPTWNPNLAAAVKGKTVLITGGGRSIGAGITRSFARASVSNICIVGRTQSDLDATVRDVEAKHPQVKVYGISFDLANTTPERCKALFEQIKSQTGTLQVDILVLNASYLHQQSKVSSIDFERDDYWQCYRVNVLGNLDLTRAFLQQRKQQEISPEYTNLTLINITSFMAYLPAFPYAVSGYASSKAAFIKTLEYLHLETPALRLFNVHPGSVVSEMSIKCGVDPDSQIIDFDDPEVCGGFCVWLCSTEADFLTGRTLEAMWDIDDLKNTRSEFEDDPRYLRIGLEGRGKVNLLKEGVS